MRYWPVAVVVVCLLGVGTAVYLYDRDSDTINCRRVPQSSVLSEQPCAPTPRNEASRPHSRAGTPPSCGPGDVCRAFCDRGESDGDDVSGELRGRTSQYDLEAAVMALDLACCRVDPARPCVQAGYTWSPGPPPKFKLDLGRMATPAERERAAAYFRGLPFVQRAVVIG